MRNESDIERALKDRLEEHGFKVFKLYTPGNTGVMDRMILRPKYSPGPPMFVELKNNKKLRPLQVARGMDWRDRGCVVLEPITTMTELEQRCILLIDMVQETNLNGRFDTNFG